MILYCIMNILNSNVSECLFSFHLPRYGLYLECAVISLSVIKGHDYWSLANKSIEKFFIPVMSIVKVEKKIEFELHMNLFFF